MYIQVFCNTSQDDIWWTHDSTSLFMVWFDMLWVYTASSCYWVPWCPRLNEQIWDQGSATLSPSHRYIKLVSNTTRDIIFSITNKTASFCAEFSYFLSLWSQILFLDSILSKAQYTTMALGFHLIPTSLWIEKRFCNTSWGLIYCPTTVPHYFML